MAAWLSPRDLSPMQGDLSSNNRSPWPAGDNRMAGAEGVLQPHQPRAIAALVGLTLVPPGWFWWTLSCCERDFRRLFSLTSCRSEGGRKGSRPHSFLRGGKSA